MNGRTCLITGATDGIGKEAAIELAKKGCNLILIGRSKEKGEKVVEQIRKVAESHVDIDYFTADLMLMKEVSRVADEIIRKYPKIDVLLNNVGAYFAFRDVTEEGFERTFALNHLGYFLMTKKLLPLVEKSDYKRIVNVSSSAHYGIDFEFDNMNGEKKYSGFDVYKKSKLANVMFTYELAKRVKDKGITANCLHPGFVSTNFGKNKLDSKGNPFGKNSLMPFGLSSKKAAKIILKAIKSKKRQVIVSKWSDIAWLGVFVHKFFPNLYLIALNL